MKKLIAYLLSSLIVLMPSVALACEAAAMQGFGTQDHAKMDVDHQGEPCHQQASDEQSNDSGPATDCPASAMCAFGSVMPLPAATIAVVPCASVGAFLPLSGGFLSADSAPLFRPPIA